MKNRAVVVGLGGIGSFLLSGLCPFLNYQPDPWELILVDGDSYEPKNHTRQVFTELGPKAWVQASWVAKSFSNIAATPVAKYISIDGEKDTKPIDQVIYSGDIVFSCVDNHKTRKLISKHCQTLNDIVLISGGNEFEDGNSQIFIRRDAENLTCTIEKYHPEIAKPKDKSPHELSCEQAAISEPQLIMANLCAASIMLNAFYSIIQDKFDYSKSEIYFAIDQNIVVPRERKK